MICEAKGCEAGATATVTSPFGTYDLCAPHTDELVPPETRFESNSDPNVYISEPTTTGRAWPDWLER